MAGEAESTASSLTVSAREGDKGGRTEPNRTSSLDSFPREPDLIFGLRPLRGRIDLKPFDHMPECYIARRPDLTCQTDVICLPDDGCKGLTS